MTSFFTAAPRYCSRFGAAVLLVVLADFLFCGQPAGITVFLFAILIAAAVVAVHPAAFSDGRVWLKPGALFVALLPLAENVSPLSVSIALVAMAIFALSLAGRLRDRIGRIAGQIALFLLATPFRFMRDFLRWRKAARRIGRRRIRFASTTVAIGEPMYRLVAVQKSDKIRYRTAQQNWRVWSFRDWRLLAYLDRRGPVVIPSVSEPYLPGR